MKLDLPNLVEETDRHGNRLLYVRKKAGGRTKRIRLRETPGTPAFLTEYQAALDAVSALGAALKVAPRKLDGVQAGSLGWLADQYFRSEEFKGLAKKSQELRRGYINGCLDEPLKPGGTVLMRACPYLRVDVTHIQMLRDRKVAQGLSGAAINRKKYMGSLFAWAIEEKKFKIKTNPCRDVKKPKHVSNGFYTWTADDVAKFVERHPIGTTAYLALCLMLFLGARRQDAIRLGPKNRRDGTMRYVPKKTTYKRVDESVKPILAPLAEAIRRTERTGLTTFLVSDRGEPFTEAGFGNKMRDWCDQAELPECTAHGLKKIAATIVAEMGATTRQMMALFDWETERMATVYTDKANKARMAADAARLLGQFSWASTPPEGEQNAVG